MRDTIVSYLDLIYYYCMNINDKLLINLISLPAIIDSALSWISSLVGFSNVTSPFNKACRTLYCIKSLINSHASYCTSRWRDLSSISTGSTMVGLATPITGWRKNVLMSKKNLGFFFNDGNVWINKWMEWINEWMNE